MSDLPPPSPEVPPGFSRLQLGVDEVDYLVRYWELKDHGELFAWGAKLLYDLTKLDESGWPVSIAKATVDEDTKEVHYAPGYRQMVMLMKWMGPSPEGWRRLPSPETLDRVLKATP